MDSCGMKQGSPLGAALDAALRPLHRAPGRCSTARCAHVIRFENVGLRYGTGPEVLRDISFTLPPGSFHFLTGASGAGKSSLLKLMYLAHRPSRGLISVFGQDIARLKRQDLPELRRQIGVVF